MTIELKVPDWTSEEESMGMNGSSTLSKNSILRAVTFISLVTLVGLYQNCGSANNPNGGSSKSPGNITSPSSSPGNLTVLVANWTSANCANFSSSLFLVNNSGVTAGLSFDVYSMPGVSGGSQKLNAQPITAMPNGGAAVSAIGPQGAVAIPLCTHIFNQIPSMSGGYTENGGNVAVVVSAGAANVTGEVRVMSVPGTISFGVAKLNAVNYLKLSKSTVLVGSYHQGNCTTYADRTYLMNNGPLPAVVSVRGITAPSDGTPSQEVINNANLMTLGPQQAVFINTCANLLNNVPVTQSNGNISLMFTIASPYATGMHQFFDAAMTRGYGAASLQEIQ